jgi:DeoR family suf operon transcriptional repressor
MSSLPPSSDHESNLPVGPIGHKGPRGTILLELKRGNGATVSELAEALECSVNAIRHHLKELEAEGVIGYDRTHKGVGAPVHTFHLTESGHALFPERYERTVADLLNHVVESQGRAAAVELLKQQYLALSARLSVEVGHLPIVERGPAIARVLVSEGYMATWQNDEAGGVLTEHHCPHQLVAERFPEICAAEQQALGAAFGVDIDRRSHIAGGCGTCSYHVADGGAEAKEETR